MKNENITIKELFNKKKGNPYTIDKTKQHIIEPYRKDNKSFFDEIYYNEDEELKKLYIETRLELGGEIEIYIPYIIGEFFENSINDLLRLSLELINKTESKKFLGNDKDIYKKDWDSFSFEIEKDILKEIHEKKLDINKLVILGASIYQSPELYIKYFGGNENA